LNKKRPIENESKEKYEVLYFHLRGRAEAIRLALAAAKQPLHENSLTFPEWAQIKPTTLLGSLPILTYTKPNGDKMVVPQSAAILRHLARKFGLYGQTDDDMTRVDYIVDSVMEFRDKFMGVAYKRFFGKVDPDPEIEYFKSFAPGHLDVLTKFVEQSPSKNGYLAADTLTIADLVAFDALQCLTQVKPSALAHHPKLVKFIETVSAHENLKAYLGSRRKPDFSVIIKD